MLFNFHVFECLGLFSLRFVSTFSPLWSEKMLGMISIFLNLLSLVLCPIMWSIFENVPCAIEKNVCFASLGWRALIYQLSPFHLGHSSVPQYLWYFVWKICPFWQWGIKISYYDCVAVNIFLEVFQDFLYVFGCSDVGCIYIYNVYVFLMDSSLEYYEVSFFLWPF